MTNRKGTRGYQKNFKVKLRRRREGKTDYKHRINMLRQDMYKFGSVKSRLVVRITNTKIICSIQKAYADGDRVVAYADSTELKKFGIHFGLTNYFAAYATGLLLGRRALAANGMDKEYSVNEDIGEYKITEDASDERRAYKVFLDIGLARATKGARVFAAMKGASDAGLYIPHSPSKFVGYDGKNLNADELRDRIFMKPLVEYMANMKAEDNDRYQKQFSEYIKHGVEPSQIQSIYEVALKQISAEGVRVKKERKPYDSTKYKNLKKSTLSEKKAKILAKLQE